MKKTLKLFAKNMGVFILGGVIGIIILFTLFLRIILEKAGEKIGLGIIGLAPVLIILYGGIFFIVGGILGVVFYLIYKHRKKKS